MDKQTLSQKASIEKIFEKFKTDLIDSGVSLNNTSECIMYIQSLDGMDIVALVDDDFKLDWQDD